MWGLCLAVQLLPSKQETCNLFSTGNTENTRRWGQSSVGLGLREDPGRWKVS